MELEGSKILCICLLFVIQISSLEVVAPENFFNADQLPGLSEAFPSCVEVADVWPPPHSALKPFSTQNSLVYYALRITFTRPVEIEDLDTTGGYQPEIINRNYMDDEKLLSVNDIAPVFLSPSPTNFTRYYPYRLKNWRGSDRTFMVYFVMSGITSRLELTE